MKAICAVCGEPLVLIKSDEEVIQVRPCKNTKHLSLIETYQKSEGSDAKA